MTDSLSVTWAHRHKVHGTIIPRLWRGEYAGKQFRIISENGHFFFYIYIYRLLLPWKVYCPMSLANGSLALVLTQSNSATSTPVTLRSSTSAKKDFSEKRPEESHDPSGLRDRVRSTECGCEGWGIWPASSVNDLYWVKVSTVTK